MNILNHVEFNDLVRTHIIGPLYEKDSFGGMKARFEVQFQSLRDDRNLVFDTSALDEMNRKISEYSSQFEARDPRAKDYIKEFAERLGSELYRNGLAVFDELQEPNSDPYADLRNRYGRN